MLKQLLLKEIDTELKARLRIWKTSDKSNERFIKQGEQERYDLMKTAKSIINAMTPAEVEQFKKKAYAKKVENSVEQKSLF